MIRHMTLVGQADLRVIYPSCENLFHNKITKPFLCLHLHVYIQIERTTLGTYMVTR